MDSNLLANLNIALEGTHVAGIRVAKDGVVELFVEVNSLPAVGPIDPDPRRTMRFLQPSLVRALVRRERDWPAGPFRWFQTINELDDFIRTLDRADDITNWEFFDASQRTRDWPERLSLDVAFSPCCARHTFWWGFDGCLEAGWPDDMLFIEGDIHFDELEVSRADGEPVSLSRFAADGRRFWDGVFGDDVRLSGEAQGKRPKEPRWGRRCPECRGRKLLPGMIKTTERGSGMGSHPGPCPTCDGLGYLTEETQKG